MSRLNQEFPGKPPALSDTSSRPDLPLLAARAEFYALACPGREFIDYVHAQGLDLERVAAFAGATGILSVMDCGNGRFDWSARGQPTPAFITEVLAADGETIEDLVAWPIDRPDHVLTMFGRVALVGAWEAFNPATFYLDKALVLHRTPLDWLKSGCRGAAIVDRRSAPRALLDIPGKIAARDADHAREVVALVQKLFEADKFVVATPADRFAA